MKRDEVKSEGISWTCKPIYSLKQVLRKTRLSFKTVQKTH